MVQCQYSIQEGQQVTGQTSFYKEAQAVRSKPRQAQDGDESPEGVIDSASLNAQPDDDLEQQEGASKKTRKRRQRRRKHKAKKQEGEDGAPNQHEDQPNQQEG